MLDSRDQAFLSVAVQRGVIAPDRAQAMAARYQGAPGGLADALVQAGMLDAATRAGLWAEASRSGSGRQPQPQGWSEGSGSSRTASDRFTPPSATLGSADATRTRSSSGSGRSSLFRTPTIPGYRIEGELGRGGMGVVYKAIQESTQRPVAIKVLLNASERHVQRFEREAQALERLRHPGVVELIETGRVNDQPFLVMEFVTGGDLKDAFLEGGLGERQVLGIMAKVARVIAHAHEHGILHRDLKPANVLLDEQREPHVTDFGLAKILDRETQLTRTNATLGTPQYMAPEQVRGDGFSEAVDAYALGVILFQLTTGELPYQEHSGVSLFRAIEQDPPPRPWEVGAVSTELGRVILWALEKDAGDRPTCLQLADALETYIETGKVSVLPPSLRRRRRKLMVLVATLVLLLGAGGLVANWMAGSREEDADARAADDAVDGLRDALREARLARKSNDLSDLLAEAEAQRAVASALKEVPESRLEEAYALVERFGGKERRLEVLRELVPLLLEAERNEEAIAHAREHTNLDPSLTGRLLLARALASTTANAAEAHTLVRGLLADAASLDSTSLERLGRVLLQLQRPALAADALAKAKDPPASLLALRGCARELSGDLRGARQDLGAAARAAERPDRLWIKTALARVDGQLGKEQQALRSLKALKKGGAYPPWSTTRALLYERRGRRGEALLALRQALTVAAGGGGKTKQDLAVPPPRLARARFNLRRGRRVEALHDLAGISEPSARLDRAVATWIGGGPDDVTLRTLRDIVASVETYAASPRLGAAASRWLAYVEVAAGSPARAEAAARKALELDPGDLSATTLAWVLLRRGSPPQDALAILEKSGATDRALEARLRIKSSGPTQALPLLRALPEGSVERLTLELVLARRLRKPAATVNGLVQRLYWLQTRGRPGVAVPVPVASAQTPARALLVARLHHEARRLMISPEERYEQLDAVLRRVVALEPEHIPARLALARLRKNLDQARAVLADCPALGEARRVRLEVLAQSVGGRPPWEVVRQDLLILAASPDVKVAERVTCAKAFLANKDPHTAWRLLEPAFGLKTRDLEAHRIGVRLAKQLKKTRQLADLTKALAEMEDTLRRRLELLEIGNVGEDAPHLSKSWAAIRVLGRDLPRNSYYWILRSQAELAEGAWALANLSGGEWVARRFGLLASGASLWLHGFGWSADAPQDLVFELAAKSLAKKPGEPGPYLGQALFLGARYYLRADKDKDLEDMERALDLCLHAVHLSPRSPGALALTADLLVTLGMHQEGEAFITDALAVDPQCQLAVYQQARLAGARGQGPQAVEHLKGLRLTKTLRRQMAEDPIFDPVRRDADFMAFLDRLGIRSRSRSKER